MNRRYYAGIGSRETPDHILRLMVRLAVHYANLGYVLRSGGAGGADSAFEKGCNKAEGAKEIYIPWRGFNGRDSRERGVHDLVGLDALSLAEKFHPNWSACSQGARKLHARNCYQILGLDLKTPVEKVFCWTPGANGGGGTGQAIRLARAHGIPIIDLADEL